MEMMRCQQASHSAWSRAVRTLHRTRTRSNAPCECKPLELTVVEEKEETRLWREQAGRYHYLGCRVPFGANLRYCVRNGNRELACLLWTSPAWKMQARDE
jgi:hypothetical protein